jgi:hypothetical protein
MDDPVKDYLKYRKVAFLDIFSQRLYFLFLKKLPTHPFRWIKCQLGLVPPGYALESGKILHGKG